MPAKDKQRTSLDRTRNIQKNSMLMPDKEVTLTGAERALIARAIERVPSSARTNVENDLYAKVRS